MRVFRTVACLLMVTGTLATSPPARAEAPLQCRVSTVHDGDSMRVRCPGERQTVRVRMHQIDAPELDQSYGTRSRDHLRELCRNGALAIIHPQGRDQYGRVLGDIFCGNRNVNEEMVASGSAWVYDRHAKDRGLYKLQAAARAERRGLWAAADPIPPWRWRHRQRQETDDVSR